MRVNKLFQLLRSSLETELDADRIELSRIVSLPDSDSNKMDVMRSFAAHVGASILKQVPGYGIADEPELINNIHIALQTKAMIAAVKTTSNYVIVSVILSIIAFISALASCVMAFK